MTTTDYDEERQMQAMVSLVEAQSQQLGSLRQAVNSLEARVALRSELDMIVAQELRMPLAVLSESLDELATIKPGDPDFDDVLHRATRNAAHLHDIVNDLLRPWRGEGPVFNRRRLEVIPVSEIIDTALKAFRGNEDADRINIEQPDGLMARTSKPRLAGIIVNVLEHALLHAPGGLVTCRMHRTTDDDLEISVIDDGPPPSDQEVDTLLQPFNPEAGDDAPPRGLGLYLVRMLARSLGGDLVVSADNGKTVTKVVLPQRRADDGDLVDEQDSAPATD